MVPVLLLLIATSGLIQAQPSPLEPVPAKPEDKCAVEGKVINAATGLPVRSANVSINPGPASASGGLATSGTTQTDAEGKFIIKSVEPGSYGILVHRAGFLLQSYGATRFPRHGVLFVLTPGQRMADLEIRITPQSVITGKVTDIYGDPVEKADVNAFRSGYARGTKQLIQMGAAVTNDLGEYRIVAIGPGKYYIGASARNSFGLLGAASSQEKENQETYAHTYYPGTLYPISATPIEVTAGGEAKGVDIQLRKTHSVRITGKVLLPPHGTDYSVGLSLHPRDDSFSQRLLTHENQAMFRTKEAFEIRGVLPGSYTLIAHAYVDGKQRIATMPVEVGDNNLEKIEFAFGPELELSGSVLVEGEESTPIAGLEVQAMQGNATIDLAAAVKKDLSFTLQGVTLDQYSLFVQGLEGDSYVKSIRLGDQELPDHTLDLTKGITGKLQVVISRKGGQIEGAVTDAKESKPAPGYTVTLIPEAGKRDRTPLFMETATDQNGHFEFKAVPPGDYKLFAWENIERGAQQDPEYMKPFESKGEPVTIKENGRATVPLKLIPAEGGS